MSPNPRCPSAEYRRTDDLIVMAHNTATLVGRLPNSLAHLLLAMQTSSMGRGEERTQEDLLSSALQTMGYQMHVGTQSGSCPLFQACVQTGSERCLDRCASLAHSKQGEKQSDTLTKVSVHRDGIELPDCDGLITTGSCSDCHYINQETETRVTSVLPNLTVSAGTAYGSSKNGGVREASYQTFTDVADSSAFRPCTF